MTLFSNNNRNPAIREERRGKMSTKMLGLLPLPYSLYRCQLTFPESMATGV
jgi:hypothetical protein